MKIQIDTTTKVIRVEEQVNLGALYTQLRKWFPNNEWKKFSIDAHTTIVWGPYPRVIYLDQPYNPYQPWITWSGAELVDINPDGTTSRIFEFNPGTYNVELRAHNGITVDGN